MLRRLLCSAPAAAFAMLLLGASAAWAAMGQPSPGEMGFQGAASPVAEEIHRFYDFVNIIEALDDITVARVSVALGARGSAKLESLPLIPVDELLESLK